VSFDNSRTTFNPTNDYSGVVMEQGRVQTDADWNEWLAELARRTQAGTLDTLGRAVYPATTPNAFKITASTSGTTNSVQIGCGRMYVDGLLVENHGDDSTAVWDPALAEMSNAPQPPPTPGISIDFGKQPYNLGATVPPGDAQYVAYLDVWRRPVTYIEDSSLVDPAIGVDTSGRLQTAWKVGLVPITSSNGFSCSTPIGTLLGLPASIGTLSNDTVGGGPVGPCCLTTGSGYTGVENQLYRVEIHTPGEPGKATFKWSRENASVQTGVTGIANGSNTLNKPAMVLTVQSLGRDQVLGFSAGDWIELTNQTLDNACLPGELYKIDHVDVPTMSITLTTEFIPGSQFSANSLAVNSYTRIIRWDQAGKLYTTADSSTPYWDLDVPMANGFPQGCGGIPVPSDGSSLVLENGITVAFSASSTGSSYLPMNYWNFAARTATGKIDPLNKKPPQGIYHHYTTLSVVTFSGTSSSNPAAAASECRTEWPSSEGGGCGCCTYTVGDNQNSFGMYTSINAAIKALHPHGGEICILPGEYYENVLLHEKKFVVIHGCGWQTHIYSAASNPDAGAQSAGGLTDSTGGTDGVSTQSGFPAVITVVACRHVELNSFCVHAAEDEVGILLDRSLDTTTAPPPGQSGFSEGVTKLVRGKGDTDVSLQDLVITATNLPAILAESIQQLKIIDNRILMSDVESIWGAVYLNGDDMLFKNNQVGLTNSDFSRIGVIGNRQELNPPEATAQKVATTKKKFVAVKDVKVGLDVNLPVETEGSSATGTRTPPRASGGVHIAGPSKHVFVVENEIQDGSRNGITLGNFILLDQYGNDTGKVTGLLWEVESTCSTGGTFTIPGSTTSTGSTSTIFKTGAGGVIKNVHIDRNLIRNMGMCGIGPVGFFDLNTSLEVIGIQNLSITANVISNTMQRSMEAFNTSASIFGYGAISLPDVEGLTIRDNIITNFGVTPGAEVCGIFVLHGELIEISRNQIRETRDFHRAEEPLSFYKGVRGGIILALATPTVLDGAGDSNAWDSSYKLLYTDIDQSGDYLERPSNFVYAPGLPALRVQENTVRVAVGLALDVKGYGPFSIADNQFSSGGPLPVSSGDIRAEDLKAYENKGNRDFVDPLLVKILNLGLALEISRMGDGYASSYDGITHFDPEEDRGSDPGIDCGGAVLFTNNNCQLEAWGTGVRGYCSVQIISADHVLFANNHLWFDGPRMSALMDAFLFGLSLQAVSNRLQESRGYPVLHSAATAGAMNITAQNISTYCLKVHAPHKFLVDSHNLVLHSQLCSRKLVVKVKRTGQTTEKEQEKP
jgi:hypothetical protein